MRQFRYSPFIKDLFAIGGEDLSALREVAEGWYVEYKSQAIAPRGLAKSLSAFANQYGGWLVIGVLENPKTLTAASFPGIPEVEVAAVLLAIRNASKDLLNPEVYFETRVFRGPISEISLELGKAVVVVRVPPGAECPYVHADGRIYRRVADSSDPKPENDKSIVDRLWERGRSARDRLAEFVTRIPVTSKAEEDSCFLHLSIFSDPYEVRGDFFDKGYSEFVEVMRENPIPFDNFFTKADGFVARQVTGNDPQFRALTWEFSRNCHSFVTLPLVFHSGMYEVKLFGYTNAQGYVELLSAAKIESLRLVDLNMLFEALIAMIVRHRTLVEKVGIRGPFFVKANLENVWRTVPFIDTNEWLQHCATHGVPVVQDKDTLAPPGSELDSFVELPERDFGSSDGVAQLTDAALIALPVFQALGIPRELFAKQAEELMLLTGRFRENQKFRHGKRK